MDEANKVVVQLIGDLGDFKATLQSGVTALVQSGQQMVAALQPMSTQLNAIYQSNSRVYSSLNIAMQRSSAESQQSAQQIIAAIRQMSRSVTESVDDVNKSIANMAQAQAAAAKSIQQSTRATADELRRQRSSLTENSDAQRESAGATGLNALAMRELMVVLRELARGDVTRLPGSLSILSGQFALTKGIVAGLISPLGAVAIAMGFIAYEANRGWTEQRDFANSLQITGNKAGMTEDSFNKLAQTLSGKTNTAVGKTREVLNTLVTSGEFTRKTTTLMAEAAIDFGHKSGIGIDAALEKFMEADRGVAKSAYELNRSYAVLTIEEAKRIKSLDDMGKKDEAEAILMQAVINKTKTMKENLGYLEKGWRTLTEAISSATQALKDWGKVPTKTDRIEGLKAEAEQIKSNIKMIEKTGQTQFGNKQGLPKEYERLAQIEAKIKALTGEIAGDEAKATKEAKDRADVQKKVGDVLKPPKENKEKGAATNSQQDRSGLLEYLNAQEDAAIKQGRIYLEREADTAAFWASEKGKYAAGTSDRLRAEIAYQSAILAIKKTGQQNNLASIREEMSQDDVSIEHKIALANKIADMNYNPKKGADSQDKAYYDSLAVIDKLEKQQSESRLREQQEVYRGFATTELEKVDSVRGALKIQLEEHRITSAQYLESMRIQAAEELNIKKKLIQDEMNLEISKGGGTDIGKIESLNNQKIALDRQYNKQLIANAQDAAKATQKPWDDASKVFENAIGSRLDGALRKHQGYGQAIRYSVGDLISYEIKEQERALVRKGALYVKDLLFKKTAETSKTIATNIGESTRLATQTATAAESQGVIATLKAFFIGSEVAKTTAIDTANATQATMQSTTSAETILEKKAEAAMIIPAEAAIAAGGAASAMASIPYVGPALAAGAYAETMALVLGGLSIASAEQGWDIPRGVNPIVQLHEEEKVLPKGPSRTLDRIETMLSSGSSFSGSSGGSGNTISPSFYISAIDASGVAKFFKDNVHLIVKSLNNHYKVSS